MNIIVAYWYGEKVHAELPVRTGYFDLLKSSNPECVLRVLVVRTGKIEHVTINELIA